MPDTNGYQDKKAFFDKVLTVYGRKPALEALADRNLDCYALHLASSNRESGIIAELITLAQNRGIPVKRHSREELARISKNGRQDQGVCADIICPSFRSLDQYLEQLSPSQPQRLLALDSISNPQNLGMIIRSAAAGTIDGIIWSRKGNAALGPLVIKASVGTLYRAPLLLCPSLPLGLHECQANGFKVYTLDAEAPTTLFECRPADKSIYVLGNETEGVAGESAKLADSGQSIPMKNGVEPLNVAVTASLIAFATDLGGHLER